MRVHREYTNNVTHTYMIRTMSGQVIQDTTETNSIIRKDLTRSDVTVVPVDSKGWRKPTPYNLRDTQVSWEFGVVQQTLTYHDSWNAPYNYQKTISGFQNLNFAPGSTDALSTDSNLINRCEIKALLKLRDQKTNTALMVVEAHKSVDMIASRVTSIVRAYSSFRKGNIRGAAKALGISAPKRGKDTANNWLELQYGWLPMLSDIHGAYQQLQVGFKKHGILLKATARQSDSGSWSTTLADNSIQKAVQENLWTTKYQVTLWYEIDNPNVLQASATGLLNPLEIAWELIPFSFVVDWALPIGDFLGALSADFGLEFKGGTLSVSKAVFSQLDWSGKSYDTGSAYQDVQGEVVASSRDFSFVRSTYAKSPVPVPYYKNPLSVGHGLNALALLRALF